ncbi:MAG: DUF3341 domain-containing protein [bacterium]|nr:DUF3341 domain-containing protein [bacterium]
MTRAPIFGIMAEFADLSGLMRAAHHTWQAGYRRVDAYTPFPVEELGEMFEGHHSRLPLLVLLGGIIGGVGGFALCYWTSVIDYPIVVGGRPFNSWPSFIPITFECTILGAALAAVVGMIVLNGLPLHYHPVFNVPGFERATQDRFFLCIESDDPLFDREATRRFLERQTPTKVSEVEH